MSGPALLGLSCLALAQACSDPTAGPPGHRPLDAAHAARLAALTSAVAPRVGHPLSATFGGGALELVGLDVEPSPLQPGAPAKLTWWWRCVRPLPHDVRMFVHAEDATQGARALGDHDLVEGLIAPSRCAPGSWYADPHELLVPANAEALTLWVGLYRWTDRLPPDAGAATDGRGRVQGPTLPVAPPDDLPLVRIPRAPQAPVADGLDSAGEWADAVRVSLRDSRTGGSPAEPTEVALLWDDEALHLRFRAEDDDVGAVPDGPDAKVWEDDAVELFLATGAGPGYVEVDVSPAGARFDASLTGPRRGLDASFAAHARVGASVDGSLRVPASPDRGYLVELSIPWARLPGAPVASPGLELRGNLFRLDRDAGGREAGQALSPPLLPDFHVPRRFARLQLLP